MHICRHVLGCWTFSIHLFVYHMCALWRNKTTYCRYILIPYERAIRLVFWYQQWLVGDVPFHLKFAFKVTHPFKKWRLQQSSLVLPAWMVTFVAQNESCIHWGTVCSSFSDYQCYMSMNFVQGAPKYSPCNVSSLLL